MDCDSDSRSVENVSPKATTSRNLKSNSNSKSRSRSKSRSKSSSKSSRKSSSRSSNRSSSRSSTSSSNSSNASMRTSKSKFRQSSSSSSEDEVSSTSSSRTRHKYEKVPRLRSAVQRIHGTWESESNSSNSGNRQSGKSSSRSISPPRKTARKSSRDRSPSKETASRSRSSSTDVEEKKSTPETLRSPINRSRKSWKLRNRSETQSSNSSSVIHTRSPTRSRSPHRVLNPRIVIPPRDSPTDRSSTRSPSPCRTRREPIDLEQNEAEAYQQSYLITLTTCDSRPAPRPIKSFPSSGFGEVIIRGLELKGYKEPTPLQAQSWPIALSGTNLVIVSGTGTGKTLSYLLPGILHIKENNHTKCRNKGPICLVLVDCREAAMLVYKEAMAYTNHHDFRSHCLMGSGRWNRPNNCELLVATAGRLLEILDTNGHEEDLDRCSYLVIDDIDRMFYVGLEDQLSRLLCLLRSRAQLVISSTTWPRSLERMANKYMGDFTMIKMDSESDSNEKIMKIRQRVEMINPRLKKDKLREELTAIYDSSDSPGKIIVYAERQKIVNELVGFVRDFVPCEGIHGGLTSIDRDDAIRAFRDGTYNIIVATEMTSRGFDVPGIKYVINYDFPNSIESYAQRLARTGINSGNHNCEVISFFTKANEKLAKSLVDFLKKHNQHIEPDLLVLAEEKIISQRSRNRNRQRQRRRNRLRQRF
ncbi:putative ATP-dependent RNA helicase CG14443 [Drosophila eugracilis]|uniref:putative ATP-dependent RNA helicase CG14443 n=1 Tax=Drosophila eugracilis TaxID=29029 RepID=UPI0007E74149|nr:putative ATP-dependent RNA helicase CG14443 [Drosophila eugracilis]